MSWDFDNKLKSADVGNDSSTDVEYKYDALGRRVARVGSSGSFVYVQSDQQTIADYGVGDAPGSPLYRYVYASYIDEPVVRKGAGTSGTIHFYHRNQQYSITAVTTSSGAIAERYSYSAYGEPTICDGSGTVIASSAINNRYSYTGREWDATVGLFHFRARWMSPKSGRFLGRDPIGYKGGILLYASKMPLHGLDPSGLDVEIIDCQRAANSFVNDKIDDFKKGCGGGKPNNIVPICKNCKTSKTPNPPGGDTRCSKDKKSIEITICADLFNDLDGIKRILEHAFQHAKDLCSCKGGCDSLTPPPPVGGIVPDDFCDKIACKELRACKVADCAGKTGEQLKNCMMDCARDSMDRSKYCRNRGFSIVSQVRDSNCVGSLEDSSLPPYPY
jgi:RHS repeat-associated protein